MFSHFSQRKKCAVGSAPGVATGCGLQLIRAGGSSRRAGAVENDFGGAQLEIPGAENDFGGAQLEIPGAENDFGGAQVVTSGLIWCCSAANLSGAKLGAGASCSL